jgi:O-acetylserine/cysteine efflux transporter
MWLGAAAFDKARVGGGVRHPTAPGTRRRPATSLDAPGHLSDQCRAMSEDRGVRAPPHRPPSRAQLHGLLGLMIAIWAANFVFAKLAVRDAPALLVACLRTVLSGAIMVPVYRWARPGPDPTLRQWTRRDVPRMAAVGVLGIVANQFAFVVALSYTSVAHGAVVGAMAPVLVLVGASVLGHERLSRRRLLGMLASAAGVAVLQLGRVPSGQASALGDLIMLGNAALFAAFSLFGKSLLAEVGTLAVNAVAFWGGALLALPYAAWGLWRLGGPAAISPAAWAGILYMSFAPSVIGYLIYAHALRYLPASRVASVTYLQPVLATLLAVAILGERPGIVYACGAAVILGGVWLVQRE